MFRAHFLWCGIILLPVIATNARNQPICNVNLEDPTTEHAQLPLSTNYQIACSRIANFVSFESQVFYPGSPRFDTDISHWVDTSSQVPACTVQPGTPRDVGMILRELAMTRTPFAVKGGGHSHNLGFSSTSGVHISMARFKDIVIHEDSGTVEIGAGLTWGEVYAHLVPKGINIVGGRMDPVGVAGFTLGGGYSWKSNQYGLAVDNVVGYELVLPNGKVKVVTDKDEDLFFGLKGGFNNFGIVTKFTVKSHKQTDIWAASFKYVGEQIAEAQAAMAKFVTREHDHKGAQFGVYIYTKGSLLFEISLFYDGPELPQGLYDEFFDLPNTSRSIFKGSYAAFVESMSHLMPEQRNGYSHGSPILHLTEPIIKAIANETEFWGEWLSKHDENVLVSSAFDPFEPDYLTHGGPSAHPPDRSRAYLPASMFIAWSKPLVEKYMEDAIRRSGEALVTAGIRDGQDLENAAPYVNYVMFDTPLEKMYGGGLERLREIRREYDPENVMGLTGGWKF